MKALKLALIGGVAVAAVAGFASVASAAAPTVSVAYNIGLATDYVFRGIDQSPGIFYSPGTPAQTIPVYSTTSPFPQIGTTTVPAIPSSLITTNDNNTETFGGIDLSYGNWYAGTWLSNTGPSQAEGLEYDIYGGYKVPFSGSTLDLGVITYNYSHGTFVSSTYNNYELKAALTVPVGPGSVGAKAYWTPDFGGTGKGGEYYEANASYTLKDKATLSGAVGYQAVAKKAYGVDGYTTWNAGVTYPVTDKLSLNASYIGTEKDASSVGTSARGKAVATATVSF